jgi:hypothetical protein
MADSPKSAERRLTKGINDLLTDASEHIDSRIAAHTTQKIDRFGYASIVNAVRIGINSDSNMDPSVVAVLRRLCDDYSKGNSIDVSVIWSELYDSNSIISKLRTIKKLLGCPVKELTNRINDQYMQRFITLIQMEDRSLDPDIIDVFEL